MLDLHYWPTPNGHKITLLLEELAEAGAGLEYAVKPVNIGKGEQFEADFLAISPNNKMPALVDHAPADGGGPLSVFESGAILLYLAGKTGRFLPDDLRGRTAAHEWLMWQMGGLGPMTGQYGHFHVYAPEDIAYAKERYASEAKRLLRVLDGRLAGRAFLAGDDYTVADMAAYPWIGVYDQAPIDMAPYPEVRRWHAAIAQRPATRRAYALGKEIAGAGKPLSDEEKRVLFGRK